ncbi:hypothetical protein BC827DRAFT_826161 [Russula dissimulans]|nr:hypothetical protein BC827DRAFT_826161 [Russula dissimulans]
MSPCLEISRLSYHGSSKWTSHCVGLHIYHEWFVVVVQTHALILCLIRVYALYGRSQRMLAFLSFAGLMSFVAATGAILAGRHAGGEIIPVLSSFVGCSQYTPPVGGRYGAIAWTGVTVFDSIVFTLTLYKAFTIGRGIRLLDVIVRDGTIYFSVLFIMNLANILSLRYSPPLLKTATPTLTNVFVSIQPLMIFASVSILIIASRLSITLVSRLVLNLREQSAVLAYRPAVETERRFQAGLPLEGQSMRSMGNIAFARPDKSTFETVTIDVAGVSA